MPGKLKVALPWVSFYESLLQNKIDEYIHDSICRNVRLDRNGNSEGCYEENCGSKPGEKFYGDLPEFYEKQEELSKDICARYMEVMAKELGITLELQEIYVPKYFNSASGEIFCLISEKDVTKLKEKVDWKKLSELVKYNHSSCDGFMSFVSADLKEWIDQEEPWSEWQLQTLFECLLLDKAGEPMSSKGGEAYIGLIYEL
jgi:hypothetical protein